MPSATASRLPPLRPGPLEVLGLETARPELVAAAASAIESVGARRIRALGSVAMTLCLVAAGQLDGMLSLRPIRSVDAAAAQLLVKEAGGAVAFPAADELSLEMRSPVLAARDPDLLERLRATFGLRRRAEGRGGAFRFHLATESASHSSGRRFELLEPNREAVRVRVLDCEPRLLDCCAVEALKPFAQHRSVVLVSEPASDVDHAGRIDAEEVAVVSEVMDCAQGESVHHRSPCPPGTGPRRCAPPARALVA